MSNPTQPASDPRAVLWDCLDYDVPRLATAQDRELTMCCGDITNKAQLGMMNVCSIEINHNQDSAVMSQTLNLDETAAETWLKQNHTQQSLPDRPRAHTKILIGHQAMPNDGLYVYGNLGQTQVSRSLVSKGLRIPESIIGRLGFDESLSVTFPQRPGSTSESSTVTYAVNTCAVSCAWSYDTTTSTTWAFIVVRRSGIHQADRLLHLLENLKDFSCHPGYLPYVLTDIEVCQWSKTLTSFEKNAEENNLDIQRFLKSKSRDPQEVFGAAAMRIGALDSNQAYAPHVLKAASQEYIYAATNLDGLSISERDRLVVTREALLEALIFRKDELDALIKRSDNLRQQTTTMLSTIMGLMSFNQQASTSEIAKAAKEDGTSMRTLSIVAALYLPTTTVSAIMAIPVFNWSAPKSNQVVNPRVWIFFVLAVPLTCITMVAFWYWVRVENSNQPFKSHKLKKDGLDVGRIV